MVRVLMNVPKQVARNEPFEVKILIAHPMESGQRRDSLGLAIPRDIINLITCTFDGETVLTAQLFPAIAANPFLVFSVIAGRSGTLAVTLTDDHGAIQTETATVTVT